MSDSKVRKLVSLFDDSRDNVHDESRSVWPSVIDDLLQAKTGD